MNKKYFWRQLTTENIFESKYFKLRSDSCELPDGRKMPRYYVVDFPDWVQVVALDKESNLILVNQYRYPANQYFLEFPGGSTDPQLTESHEAAARRELLEETGFESEQWRYLGYHYPNPALMGNKCHVYLAENCVQVKNQQLDPFEVLDVKLCSKNEFADLMRGSEPQHSLMLATYMMAKRFMT